MSGLCDTKFYGSLLLQIAFLFLFPALQILVFVTGFFLLGNVKSSIQMVLFLVVLFFSDSCIGTFEHILYYMALFAEFFWHFFWDVFLYRSQI